MFHTLTLLRKLPCITQILSNVYLVDHLCKEFDIKYSVKSQDMKTPAMCTVDLKTK